MVRNRLVGFGLGGIIKSKETNLQVKLLTRSNDFLNFSNERAA